MPLPFRVPVAQVISRLAQHFRHLEQAGSPPVMFPSAFSHQQLVAATVELSCSAMKSASVSSNFDSSPRVYQETGNLCLIQKCVLCGSECCYSMSAKKESPDTIDCCCNSKRY
ncbi:unnamed protein product [Onchocerca flexuosa]|uniref:UBR-type domain-containing protein n=1 Tax=Onchocerca flexuosa TaxID=387005 RepID=A0A183H314_9BILA|nr:unnamed protein product [Onchocerca flexuosa]